MVLFSGLGCHSGNTLVWLSRFQARAVDGRPLYSKSRQMVESLVVIVWGGILDCQPYGVKIGFRMG